MSVAGSRQQFNQRLSQPAYPPQSRPVAAPLSLSGNRLVRGMISPPSHQPVTSPAYRYLPQRSINLASPHSKRNEHFDVAQYSPDAKRRRTAANLPVLPVRQPQGPQSPAPSSASHRGRQSLPRLDALGLNQSSPVTVVGTPRQPFHQERLEKPLTLAPLRSAQVNKPRESETDTQAKTLEAMILSIPVLNKIKVLAKISAPFGFSPPSSPVSAGGWRRYPGKRGLLVAIDAADQTAIQQITRTISSALKDFDIRIMETPQLHRDQFVNFKSYLSLIHEYHILSEDIIAQITTPRSSSPRMNRYPEHYGEVAENASTSRRIHSRGSNPGSSDKREELMNSGTSPISPNTIPFHISSNRPDTKPSDATASSPSFSSSPKHHSHSESPSPASRHRPQMPSWQSFSFPQTQSSTFPIIILPRWQLTHTDSFACSVEIADRYSPIDHWQWGATVWRGVIGADVTVAVRASSSSAGRGGGAISGRPGSDDHSSSPASSGEGSSSIGEGNGHKQPLGSATATVAIPSGTPGAGAGAGSNTASGPNAPGNNNSIGSNSGNVGSSSTSQVQNLVDIRLEEAGAVIVKGEQDGSIAEGALRRVGFEVGEWIRGLAERWDHDPVATTGHAD